MGDYLLGLDAGNTVIKAVIFDLDGHPTGLQGEAQGDPGGPGVLNHVGIGLRHGHGHLRGLLRIEVPVEGKGAENRAGQGHVAGRRRQE